MNDIKTPETAEELIDWIDKRAHQIFVRARVSGGWQSLPLTELPAREAITYVCRFLRERIVPAAFLDEDEVTTTPE